MRAEGESSHANGTSRPFSNGSGASPLHKAALSNLANGRAANMNGFSNINGHSSGKPRPLYHGHDREETTRILIQALTELGYDSAASNLSQESGFVLETGPVANFRNAVLGGEWMLAEELLFGAPTDDGGVRINGNGLVLQEGVDRNVMRFCLRQQKFLELLEKRDTGGALMVLRRELTPLYQDIGKLHFLSTLLMCHSIEDLKIRAEWDGAAGHSRDQLLSELSKCISPSVMLPDHRLATILHQVKTTQIEACLYHSTRSSPSLYQDHVCDQNKFPRHAVLELLNHQDEVWQVKFSHNGTMLASCGADGLCYVYEVGSFDVLQTFTHQTKGVSTVSWSPDDTMIVTCSHDKFATLWDVNTGLLIQRLPQFGEPVTSCVWAPDGQTFVTSCLDIERNLCQWNLRGELIHDWKRSHRIQDLAVSPNGQYLVAMSCEKAIYVYNFVTRDLDYDFKSTSKNCSVDISHNSRHLLVNACDGEPRILDLDKHETVREFPAHQSSSDFVIRAAFGGADESFVLHGSEDGYLYIWHKATGALVEKLEAHGDTSCNSVAWSPFDATMFATCGDDHKVKIWGNWETLQGHQQHPRFVKPNRR